MIDSNLPPVAEWANRSHFPSAFCAMLFLLPVARLMGVETPTSVRVERIDGGVIEGHWRGLADASALQIEATGTLQRIPLDSISVIGFGTRQGMPGKSGAQFLLNDGGTLVGELVADIGVDAVIARCTFFDQTVLPFDRLAAIRLADALDFPRSQELFESALRQRLPGQDQLITRSVDEPRVVRGRLESLRASGGSFSLGDSARTLPIERMYAIVFASGASPPTPLPASMVLNDGTSFTAKLREGSGSALTVETSFGLVAEIPVERIVELHFQSDRISYVGQRSPTEQRVEGRLHRPWPIRIDRNVAGAPMSLNGRVFRKGIGVHSFTELAYDLDAPYESFAATIGIDDAVRPRGHVVFRIFGEEGIVPQHPEDRGTVRLPLPADPATKKAAETRQESPAGKRLLFDSGPVSGRDPGRDVLVDIRGIRRLWLVVDYGEELDLSDFADWAAARLIKPARTPHNP